MKSGAQIESEKHIISDDIESLLNQAVVPDQVFIEREASGKESPKKDAKLGSPGSVLGIHALNCA